MKKQNKMLLGSIAALFLIFLGFQNFENVPRPNDMYMHSPKRGTNTVNLNCEAFSKAINYCTLASAETIVQIEDENGQLHAYHCNDAILLYRTSNCMQGM